MKRRKNSKKGIAMVMALIVSFLVMVMATSYLGITGAGTKAAKNYRQESIALSVAQSGLEAVINAMGNKDNWSLQRESGFNVFTGEGASDRIRLNIRSLVPSIHTSNLLPVVLPNADNREIDLTNGTISLTVPPVDMARGYIGRSFLGLAEGAPLNQFFTSDQNIITLEDYGDGNGRFAALLVAVCPDGEVQFAEGMVRNNINYNVIVASFIYNRNPGDISGNPFTNELVASRTIKARVSYAFPGSIYSNVRAYDVPPNPRDFIFGGFSAPNFEHHNADAAFIDENSYWDSGIRIDGADLASGQNSNDPTNRWGAPQKTGDFLNGDNGRDGWAIQAPGATGNILDTNGYDTSGSLKVAFLDPSLEASAMAGTLSTEQRDRIRSFKSVVSTEKGSGNGIVFQELGTGTWHSENGSNSGAVQAIRESITDPRAPVDQGRMGASNMISSIWETVSADGTTTNYKMSTLTTASNGTVQASDGLFNKVSGDSVAANAVITNRATDYNITYGLQDYQPDPMYGNQKMQAPTVRVTINQAANNETQNVTIQEIGYTYNSATGKPAEVVRNSRQVNIADQNFPGVITIRGANVQVVSEASGTNVTGLLKNSLTVVSDENPQIALANRNALNTSAINTAGNYFDNNLTAPNYIRNGEYQFLDLAINDENVYDVNTAVPSTKAGAIPISAATPEEIQALSNDNSGHWVYPTVNEQSEQPQGNLSIIGDVVRETGSQAELALVASNRVYLNDFGHTQALSQRSNNTIIDDQGRPILSSTVATNDGILKVDATIASQKHNMTVDFSNFSKNIGYTNSNIKTGSSSTSVNLDAVSPVGPPGFALRTAANSPYVIPITNELHAKLSQVNNSGAYVGRLTGAIGTNTVGSRFDLYGSFSQAGKKAVWRDFAYGAVRLPNNADWSGNMGVGNEERNGTYSQGLFDFTGAIISRFADVEADAGKKNTSGLRVNQMGYPVQSMSFDANLLDRSAPFFSISNGILSRMGDDAVIRWHILSYVDRGSILNQRGAVN